MILICGIPTEAPVALVIDAAKRLGIDYLVLNQRHFSSIYLEFEVNRRGVTGELRYADTVYRLEDFSGIYNRLTDFQVLPEVRSLDQTHPVWQRAMAVHETLNRWIEIAPVPVMNRLAPMATNFSKPFQAQLIQEQGLVSPETLITNDPTLVLDFQHEHSRVIYKSISGVRSIVQEIGPEDYDRLDRIRWCPTQFQRFIDGTNVRVHVVGDQVFATSIETTVTDYRYAHQQGGSAMLSAVDLEPQLADQCVKLSHSIGLMLAGIDLKCASDRRWYCFEVNPSPAFSYYQSHTEQPIADAIVIQLSHKHSIMQIARAVSVAAPP